MSYIADNPPNPGFVPSQAIAPSSQGHIQGSYGTVGGWSKARFPTDPVVPKEELHNRIEAYKKEVAEGKIQRVPPGYIERGFNKLFKKGKKNSTDLGSGSGSGLTKEQEVAVEREVAVEQMGDAPPSYAGGEFWPEDKKERKSDEDRKERESNEVVRYMNIS